MIKKCIQCEKEFKPSSNARKTCSSECSKQRKSFTDKLKVSGKKLTCKICSSDFVGKANNQYCSKECKSKGHKNKLASISKKAVCEVCCATFYCGGKIRKYCSEECKTQYYKNNPRHTKKCVGCGIEFKTNDKKRRYCTFECSNNHLYNPLKSNCQNCGKEYSVKAENAGVYCSWTCRMEKSKCKGMKGRRRLRDGQHIRRAKSYGVEYESIDVKKVFEMNNWTCAICNEHVDEKLLFPDSRSATLDHIIPLSKGGGHTLDNVQLAHLNCNVRKLDNL